MNQIASAPAQLELGINVSARVAFAEGRHTFFASQPFMDLCSDPEDSLVRSRVKSLLTSYGLVNWSVIQNELADYPGRSVRSAVLEVIDDIRSH